MEVAVFYGQLSDLPEGGVGKACSHSRHDLCMLVKEVWLSINHEASSHKGYLQTGPELSLTGPIYMKDICRDLRELVKEMCPHDDPEQVGTEIREEARQLVNSMWGKPYSVGATILSYSKIMSTIRLKMRAKRQCRSKY